MSELKQTISWKTTIIGDHALLFSLPAQMDPITLAEVSSLNNFVIERQMDGILDIIPSYHTLTLIYDMDKIKAPYLLAKELLNDYLNLDIPAKLNGVTKSIIEIPVCYDLIFGIDLISMCAHLKLSIDEIIKAHYTNQYNVYCLGFMPGFAYMGNVTSNIQMARHQKPRQNIFAGSVGIAGEQTGIYPKDSPGGWQIIGRTPLKIFDQDPTILAKLKVGDRIQFYPITLSEFESVNEYK